MKWFAISPETNPIYRQMIDDGLKNMGFKTVGTTKVDWLEMSKILDTSQYGILITFAQTANRICEKRNINYEFVRDFMSQTHELYGVRPDITPGYAGGHCVPQNIELLDRFAPNALWKVFKESNSLRANELGMKTEKEKTDDSKPGIVKQNWPGKAGKK
jgi:hypothetical protein